MRGTTKAAFSRLAAMILLAAGTGGCSAIAEGVATRITDRALSKVEHEVTVIDGDVALFRQCLESRGGTCQGGATTGLPQTQQATGQVEPLSADLSASTTAAVDALGPDHPAQAGRKVFSHPFLKKIVAVHNHLRGLDSPTPVPGVEVSSGSAATPQSTVTLSTSPEEVSDFVDQVNQATASGSWRSLSHQTKKQASASGSAKAQQDARTAAFIDRYTAAYFENGKYFKIELDTQDLNAKIEKYLTDNVSLFCGDPSQTEQCDALVTDVQNAILKGVAKDPANKDFVLLPLGTTGYVARTGQGFAFPGVQITLDPAGAKPVSVAKIDMTTVGTDLVWVFFQALFDSHEGLPAVSTATGVSLGTADQAFDLPVFDPSVGNVSTKDFQDINSFSNQVSAAVGTAFDKVIRGLGPFSLNNEALEELLVAIVTVTVNNVAQKGAWCWFSCNLDQQVEKAAADEREKVHSDFSKAAKRIKLRFRFL
jgi:hypothetical protein